MAIQINLPPEKEDLLKHEAGRRGIEMEDYARHMIEESLPQGSSEVSLSRKDEERYLNELAELGASLVRSIYEETYSRDMIYAEHD